LAHSNRPPCYLFALHFCNSTRTHSIVGCAMILLARILNGSKLWSTQSSIAFIKQHFWGSAPSSTILDFVIPSSP
jgi:hypothetical protein